MRTGDYFKIIHLPTDLGKFENFILDECCSEKQLISCNNNSFSFDAFIGCSNNCSYCYMRQKPYNKTITKKGPIPKQIISNTKDYELQIETEIGYYLPEIQKSGLITSFISDPMLPEVFPITMILAKMCSNKKIPLRILTKRADWLKLIDLNEHMDWVNFVSFGFTLTNADAIEPSASPNEDRIAAINYLHTLGFRVFCSIEPIIDCEKSFEAIKKTFGKCEHYKIGFDTRRKYEKDNVVLLLHRIARLFEFKLHNREKYPQIIIKDNVLEYIGCNKHNFCEFLGIE